MLNFEETLNLTVINRRASKAWENKYFFTKTYSGKSREGKTVRVCVCILQRQKKKQDKEIKSLMGERQKVPLGPSSDLALVKSISVTPSSKT